MSENPRLKIFQSKVSRREFLGYFGMAFAGLLIPRKWMFDAEASSTFIDENPLLARVFHSNEALYQAPNVDSDVVERMEKDSVRRITGFGVGEVEGSPNRIWYELGGKGYVHAARIQTVRRKYHTPKSVLPQKGCLGEISVPFVDAFTSLKSNAEVVYRLYYASTIWVLASLVDDKGRVWYQVLNDRTYQNYYVPAYHVRLVPDSELTPISPDVPPEEKKIIVDLEKQTLKAYERERLVYLARISSGVRQKEGYFATPRGNYHITRKRPCRHMYNPPNEFGTGFNLPGVPWVSYYTFEGIALHGANWHNDFGIPNTHGCINLTPQAAKWVYRWTTPSVPPERYYYGDINGTHVIIQ